jgi:hypothetical protein
MDDTDFLMLAGRLSDAVGTMNETSVYVYRMLEIIIWDEVLRASSRSADGSATNVSDIVEGDVTLRNGKAFASTRLPDTAEPIIQEFDILDLVLEKAAGMALIKHLYSLVLYGKISKGPPTKKPKSKAVKVIAQHAYRRLCSILPALQPTNIHQISLRRPIVAAAQQAMVCLRSHFRKLPLTVGARVCCFLQVLACYHCVYNYWTLTVVTLDFKH